MRERFTPGLGKLEVLTDSDSHFPETACGVYSTAKLVRCSRESINK